MDQKKHQMPAALIKETFKPLLNTSFTITFDQNNAYEVELVQVKEFSAISELDVEPFSLLFRGKTTEIIFSQRIYKIFSEKTGELDLFLVPIQPDDKGIYYECIIT